MNKKHRLKLLFLLSFYASVSHAQPNIKVDSNLLSGHHTTQPQVWGIVIFVMIILLAASYFLTKAINNRKKNSP